MLDFITVVCWAAVYLIIIFCTKNQEGAPKSAIPIFPPILNLSWEISALISCEAFWGHVIWFGLSILVFESCMATLDKKTGYVFWLFRDKRSCVQLDIYAWRHACFLVHYQRNNVDLFLV